LVGWLVGWLEEITCLSPCQVNFMEFINNLVSGFFRLPTKYI